MLSTVQPLAIAENIRYSPVNSCYSETKNVLERKTHMFTKSKVAATAVVLATCVVGNAIGAPAFAHTASTAPRNSIVVAMSPSVSHVVTAKTSLKSDDTKKPKKTKKKSKKATPKATPAPTAPAELVASAEDLAAIDAFKAKYPGAYIMFEMSAKGSGMFSAYSQGKTVKLLGTLTTTTISLAKAKEILGVG